MNLDTPPPSEGRADQRRTVFVAVTSAVAEFNYGETISRAWLEAKLGVVYPTRGSRDDYEHAKTHFLAVFTPFRAELLSAHKMDLVPAKRGYRVVPPREQGGRANEDMDKEVRKAVRRAGRRIRHTRVEMLSTDELRAHNEAAGKHAAFRAMAYRGLRGGVKESE